MSVNYDWADRLTSELLTVSDSERNGERGAFRGYPILLYLDFLNPPFVGPRIPRVASMITLLLRKPNSGFSNEDAIATSPMDTVVSL